MYNNNQVLLLPGAGVLGAHRMSCIALLRLSLLLQPRMRQLFARALALLHPLKESMCVGLSRHSRGICPGVGSLAGHGGV